MPILSHDFMPGGKGYQVTEPFEGDSVAIVDQPANGLFEGGDLSHGTTEVASVMPPGLSMS